MMVVLIIIGIMSAAMVAEMHGTMADALLRSTSRELIGAFDVASSRAVSLNRPHRIRLDQVAHRFYLERSARGGLDFIPVRDLPGSRGDLDGRLTILIRPLPEEPVNEAADETAPADAADAEDTEDAGVEAPGSKDAVTFYPDGTADAREIVLTDRDGFSLALRVNPVNARVEIAQKERE
jgi:type II secretory pathway pseudopilin PulG